MLDEDLYMIDLYIGVMFTGLMLLIGDVNCLFMD